MRRLFRLGLRRPDAREEVEWEIAHYLSEMEDRLVEQGWSREQAAAEATRRFGKSRDYRRGMQRIERRRGRMERWKNVRVALAGAFESSVRSLARQPGFTAVVALTLGIGIGANAAMFTILDRLLFQPPAHVSAHEGVRRVVVERSFLGELARGGIGTLPDAVDLREHGGLASVAVYSPRNWTMGRGAEAEKIRAVTAEHTLFPLLGVTAARGRFYGGEDDRPGAEPVVVLSHEFWSRRWGADPDVLGSTVEIEGLRLAVVGIAPRGFTGADVAPVDAWVPLHVGGVLVWSRTDWAESRGRYWLSGVVRLGDGVSAEAASEEATQLHRAGRREQLDAGRYDPEVRVVFDPLIRARGPGAGAESRVARWLGGVSILLLLIVCANVANLLLARGIRRHREVAIRLALGVSGRRLVGQTVLETVLLGLAGSVVGLAVATWGGAVIRRVLLPNVHFPAALGFRVVAFTVTLSVVAGTVAGIAPALQSLRLNLARDLASGGRTVAGRSRTRSVLTAAQAALSVVLLAGAGLFVRSVQEVRSLDLGLDVDQLATAILEFEVGSPLEGGGAPALSVEERNRIYVAAAGRLEDVGGVRSTVTSSPFGWGFASGLEVPGWDSLPDLPGGGPYHNEVAPGYFETVGLQVLQGRPFQASDGAGAEPVALVNQTMARTLWPDERALGQCLLVAAPGEQDVSDVCTTVVGVVEDASRGSLEEEAHMTYYMPLAQRAGARANGLYVRADDPSEAAPRVAAILRDISPTVRFAEVRTLREALDPQARSWTMGAALFSVFGALALLVAAIGLYGVLAFHVAQQTRELGIRSALGAAKSRLLGQVLAHGLRLTVVGIVVGCTFALALAPFAGPLLFRVPARDPVVLLGVAVTLLGVGVLASLLPGLRATRVDPNVALRAE